MIFINCSFLKNLKCLDFETQTVSVEDVRAIVSERTGVPVHLLSVYCGKHQLLYDQNVPNGSTIHLTFSLPGGKGGFGSMLRAIGAQIEKTTNREACRDLTGRRLRDINEEQRLKKWLSKKSERETEAAKRRKARLERLKEAPKHDFHDPEYNKQRAELPERIDDALAKGLKKSVPVIGKKHKSAEADGLERSLKKQCLWLGLDEPSSDSESSNLDQPSCSGAEGTPVNDKPAEGSSVLSEDQSSEEGNSNSEDSHTDQEFEAENGDSEVINQVSTNADHSIKNEHSVLLNDNETKSLPNSNDSMKVSSSECNSLDGHQNSESSNEFEEKESNEINILEFTCTKELEDLGLDKLKTILMSLGLKCGGTLSERAHRLWAVRGLDPAEYPSSLKAKPKKN